MGWIKYKCTLTFHIPFINEVFSEQAEEIQPSRKTITLFYGTVNIMPADAMVTKKEARTSADISLNIFDNRISSVSQEGLINLFVEQYGLQSYWYPTKIKLFLYSHLYTNVHIYRYKKTS